MSECIYASIIQAKNGTSVPAFTNGRTFFSSYNPERDADAFLTVHEEAFKSAGCILVGGIGNALHIKKLSETFPDALIIAFEADEESLAFARKNFAFNLPESVLLTSTGKLSSLLPVTYNPALHGNFAFAAVRSWADYLSDRTSAFVDIINRTISDISADYSVQAQFGKLWHRNILLNLELFDNIPSKQLFNPASFSHSSKKAAIIGAGPSLDSTLHILTEKRSEYCIFATDTSFSTLKAAGITPDFVVTVDSQQISGQHFIGQDFNGTVLAADLTGNSSLINNAVTKNAQVLLFHNNHPLSQLIDNWLSEEKGCTAHPFTQIDTGAGTVLHAATDLSRKLGFTENEFFGADFAYANGKPYTKGTYLEKQFYSRDERKSNAETAYSRLMFRAPLIKLSDKTQTTEVLIRYREALSRYLSESHTDSIENTGIDRNLIKMHEFVSWYEQKLHEKDKKVLFSILPLAAWYKKNFVNADTECVYAFAEQQTANVGRIQCHLQKK